MDTYCLKCGQRYRLGTDHACQPKFAAKKSTAARKDVPGLLPVIKNHPRDSSPRDGYLHKDSERPLDTDSHMGLVAGATPGTQALAVDTKRKPGRPRTITDMRAYKAQKERERRAKIKGKME